MIVRLLTEHHLESLIFKGGCTGSSESTLVKMPHCWKSHVTAHLKKKNIFQKMFIISNLVTLNTESLKTYSKSALFVETFFNQKLNDNQDFSKECVPKKNSYFSTKTYVVGTQKNRLNETVLLSTQNTCLN